MLTIGIPTAAREDAHISATLNALVPRFISEAQLTTQGLKAHQWSLLSDRRGAAAVIFAVPASYEVSAVADQLERLWWAKYRPPA
jgi:hypothetical protein